MAETESDKWVTVARGFNEMKFELLLDPHAAQARALKLQRERRAKS